MGYLHISNLYKDTKILNFKRCYALEKVHGTSAHVAWKDGEVRLFSGGAAMITFAKLFDKDALKVRFQELGHPEVVVYGEAYGGSMQGMKETYGSELRFIAFDVRVGETWVTVPNMDSIATKLGFEVVPWEEISTELPVLDALRDKPSEVAIRRGMGTDKQREGVVLRPLEEMTTNNDHRVIVKHKIEKFGERWTEQKVRNVDGEKLKVIAEAKEIAREWVTPMRLDHVLDKLKVDGVEPGIEKTGQVIRAMVEDVLREAKDEIVESKEATAAIGRATAELFKQRLQDKLKEAASERQGTHQARPGDRLGHDQPGAPGQPVHGRPQD